MNNTALDLVRRANSQGISISHLCHEAGVSRSWFEKFKKRTPESVEIYLRIDKILSDGTQYNSHIL